MTVGGCRRKNSFLVGVLDHFGEVVVQGGFALEIQEQVHRVWRNFIYCAAVVVHLDASTAAADDTEARDALLAFEVADVARLYRI